MRLINANLLISLFLSFTSFVNAENININQFNQKLKQAGATWVAKDSWVNQLPNSDVKRMMGALGVKPKDITFQSKRDLYLSQRAGEVVDWRNRDGTSYVSPILNQGNCGSCVAFAAVSTLSTQMNITTILPQLNPQYSTQALFACGGGSCDRGWMPSSAARYIQRTGVPDEACAPYTMGADGKDVSCRSICSDAKDRSQKISSSISIRNMEDTKAALRKGPLMTTLTVYADFLTYASGVYKHTTGAALGGHAVSLVGFDDTKQAWIIKNSWGESWGDKGFAYVAYSDTSGVGDDNIAFNLPAPGGTTYVSLKSRDFVSGNQIVKAQSTLSNTKSITTIISKSSGTNTSDVMTLSCQSNACEQSADFSSLPSGKYFIRAIATDGTRNVTSLTSYFYVANEIAQYSLSLKPSGFNPGAPVKGRIEFDLSISSNSEIPLKRIGLQTINSKGESVIRWSENIAPETLMGWRTNAMPNDTYLVNVLGEAFGQGQIINVSSETLKIVTKN